MSSPAERSSSLMHSLLNVGEMFIASLVAFWAATLLVFSVYWAIKAVVWAFKWMASTAAKVLK